MEIFLSANPALLFSVAVSLLFSGEKQAHGPVLVKKSELWSTPRMLGGS
jgi:hypothetical protein